MQLAGSWIFVTRRFTFCTLTKFVVRQTYVFLSSTRNDVLTRRQRWEKFSWKAADMIYNDTSVLFIKHITGLFALFVGGMRLVYGLTVGRWIQMPRITIIWTITMNQVVGRSDSSDERENDEERYIAEVDEKRERKGCYDIFSTGN